MKLSEYPYPPIPWKLRMFGRVKHCDIPCEPRSHPDDAGSWEWGQQLMVLIKSHSQYLPGTQEAEASRTLSLRPARPT